MSATILQIESSLIVMLMIFGVMNRKNRKLHVRVMLSSIIWDLLLIAQIELSRGAIAKASKVITNPMILNIHVSLAISCVAMYCVVTFSGVKILKNKGNRNIHKKAGAMTLILRMATYITSYWAA
jgi:uncharacterized membrane protein YozB (DUF420 family)